MHVTAILFSVYTHIGFHKLLSLKWYSKVLKTTTDSRLVVSSVLYFRQVISIVLYSVTFSNAFFLIVRVWLDRTCSSSEANNH